MPTVDPIIYELDDGETFTVEGFISSRLMAAYAFDGHTLHLHADSRDVEGRVRYSYVLEHDGAVIFEADDFRSGCGDDVDYAKAARCLMGFLTLCEGDTDAEYFDGYTPSQITWRDEYAESLAIYAD